MKLYSPNFQNNQIIPTVFTSDGSNKCPDFIIEKVPDSARSLVILCHDPDATAGIPWVHWLAWGLPPVDKIIGGQLPEGSINGLNSFGNYGYDGPSPNPGTGLYRYVFTIFAMIDEVDLGNLSSYEEVVQYLNGRTVEHSSWVGTYERK